MEEQQNVFNRARAKSTLADDRKSRFDRHTEEEAKKRPIPPRTTRA